MSPDAPVDGRVSRKNGTRMNADSADSRGSKIENHEGLIRGNPPDPPSTAWWGSAAVSASHSSPNHSPFRIPLILAAVGVLTVLVIVPVVHVFYQALAHGPGVYWRHLLGDANTRHAILLTLTVAPAAVVLNLVFGVAAAWAIARFRFPGRALLLALIDLPFAVSPVVVGLAFMLLFGLQGYFGPWLRDHGIRIIFALPGLILVTAFVTFPFVARELIP